MNTKQVWIPVEVARAFKVSAARLNVSQLDLIRRLILERDNEAWQALYWALGLDES